MKTRIFSRQFGNLYVSLWIGLYGFSRYANSSKTRIEYKLGLFMLRLFREL